MITTLAIAGDSIDQGFGDYDIENGGKGCHVELIFEHLASIYGLGPLIGPGYRGIWRDVSITATGGPEWSSAGSWTKTVSTDAFDKNIGGYAYYSSAGSGATRLWTRPSQWRACAGGVSVYYVDTGGNWQYRVNGGAWTNHGQTINATGNPLRKFYISGTISTIEFRAYDGASSAAICLCGVEPYYVTPQDASGFIGHNLGLSGINLHDVAPQAGQSGDRLAWFDSVTVGTGSPPAHQPSIVILGTYSNDVVNVNNVVIWAADQDIMQARLSPFARIGFINCYEQGSSRDTTVQGNYRSNVKSKAVAQSPAWSVLDLRDAWNALGFGTYLLARTPGGLLDAGSVHPSQAGYLDLALRVAQWIRVTYFSSYANVSTSLPAIARSATLAATGTRAIAATASPPFALP